MLEKWPPFNPETNKMKELKRLLKDGNYLLST